ncbi:MAG: hypothetical protein WAO52_02420 [Prolixibacteraceae bacterium]
MAGRARSKSVVVNVAVGTSTDTTIEGIVMGQDGKLRKAQSGLDYTDPNDSRLSDAREPTDNSTSWTKVAADLKSKSAVSSTIDLSGAGIGTITLTANTSFNFTGYQLNKNYLLIVNTNGFVPSFSSSLVHVLLEGNATLGNAGTFYISLTCIDSTPGSEKVLTLIMKGA